MLVNSSRPCLEPSLPNPDILTPPKGASQVDIRGSLIPSNPEHLFTGQFHFGGDDN